MSADDPILEALWNKTLEDWEDERTHTALLQHAAQTEGLPEIAGRYRALCEDPDKAPIAKKRLDAIVLAATQMLLASKTERRQKIPLPITLSAFAVCAFLLGWLVLALRGP